jgi:hypothetical protein
MSYHAKDVERKKKGKKKYFKAYTMLTNLAISSIRDNSYYRKRLIRKFKKIYNKKNYFSYYREQSHNYYRELEIYDKLEIFDLNFLRIMEDESNRLIRLNKLCEEVLFLTGNDSEKRLIEEIFKIYDTILSVRINSELKTFIDNEKAYYSLIYRIPRFKRFPKDKYYSLFSKIFLEFIGLKARETNAINIIIKGFQSS